MTRILTSSTLPPLSGSRPRQIVLLLHGYGSNGADLISLAPYWRPHLPDALFIAPDAPQRSMGMRTGYQWWALNAFTRQALAAGAALAAPAVDAFIDEQLAEHGLTEAQLALVGFSQGTMMALHVGLRRARPVAGIVGYSGMLTGAATLDGEMVTKPPVLLIHGSADPVVPVASLHDAEAKLRQLGISVDTHVSRGLGHSVDPDGLRLGGEFVRRCLGAKP